MTLRLIYKAETTIPIELDGLLPEKVKGLPLPEVEQLPVFWGNRRVPLGDLFSLSGDTESEQLDFEGDLSGVHRIGAAMTSGTVRVHGSAGRHVGCEMTGGRIEIRGDAGDWLGAEMHGGEIHVLGNAGDCVGAAYRGAAKGMTGGAIVVEGNAGDEVGAAMRRGAIGVGGKAGEMLGVNMLAGTILAVAGCGARPGTNMRRGTIVLTSSPSPEMPPTFRHACRYRPTFLPLVLRALNRCGLPLDPTLAHAEYELYSGDMLETGRGEILVRA
jgi:formylmethanofuran dehydrogenase subunit C